MNAHQLLDRIKQERPSETDDDILVSWLLSAAESLGLDRTQLHNEVIGYDPVTQSYVNDSQLGPPTMGDHEDEARRKIAYS